MHPSDPDGELWADAVRKKNQATIDGVLARFEPILSVPHDPANALDLEPTAAISQAISLKRIADTLERIRIGDKQRR